MLEIKDIVNVIINRESVSKTVRDLKTIAIVAASSVTGLREYTSTTQLLDDGYLTTDFAYIAANRIFSQNPQVRSILVYGYTANPDGIDYIEQIRALQGVSNEWFYLITDAQDREDKVAIAEFAESQTMFYVFSDSTAENITNATTDIFSELKEKGLTHVAYMHNKDASVIAPEAAWVGRFAAVDIGGTTWIHKTLVTLVAQAFTPTEVAILKSKNAHFYTKVGQDSVIEGNARVAAGETIKTILGAIWLEVRIGEATWNLLYTKETINYTNAGIEQFKAVLVQVLNEAVVRNILTDDDGFQIKTPDANKLTSQERESGYLRKVTFRARLAGAILFVDAIEGTVYA